MTIRIVLALAALWVLGAVFGEVRTRIGARVADRIVPAGVPTTYVLSLVLLRIAAVIAPAGPRQNAALSARAELQLDREQSRELRPLRVACPILVSCTGALTSELAALPRIVWMQVVAQLTLVAAVANGVFLQDVSLWFLAPVCCLISAYEVANGVAGLRLNRRLVAEGIDPRAWRRARQRARQAGCPTPRLLLRRLFRR